MTARLNIDSSSDLLSGADPLAGFEGQVPGQWYQDDTYYQILYIERNGEQKKGRQNITTTIQAKSRGEFKRYELDNETIDKLSSYPGEGDKKMLSAYLPSPGVFFPANFIKALSQTRSTTIEQTELANFYQPMRSLLYSRKISQLIAKTWWSYLEAIKPVENGDSVWKKFTDGNWDGIDSDLLDGLIAREIFLFAGGDAPDRPDPEDPTIYQPLKPRKGASEKARFLILPSSKSWQGISLSLLFAGQAYYKIGDRYHQISQPILSTGQIVSQYSHEVDWNSFNGNIKEILISQEKPWIAYQVVIPYPPIPSSEQLDPKDIKVWATAEDDSGDLPFYKKKDDEYLMDVDYFRSPFPYIPLSCT